MKKSRFLKYGAQYLLGYKLKGIGLNLTRRCNLDCEYCKVKDTPKTELAVNDWKKIISKLHKNKHRQFIFTGGEPLLYEGVYELIQYTSKRALTSLITNTVLLDKSTFQKLKPLDFLTFSFDSLKNSKKNPRSKLEMISNNCKKHKIRPSGIITITSKNIDEVPQIIKILSKYNIGTLLSIIHSSKGNYDFRNYSPKLEINDINKLKSLEESLLILKKKGYLIEESQSFINNMHNFINGKFQIKCPATKPFLTIDTDGYIKACHDSPSSQINALDYQNYNMMLKEVRKSIRPDCNCYYDCYVNSNNSQKNQILIHTKRCLS